MPMDSTTATEASVEPSYMTNSSSMATDCARMLASANGRVAALLYAGTYALIFCTIRIIAWKVFQTRDAASAHLRRRPRPKRDLQWKSDSNHYWRTILF